MDWIGKLVNTSPPKTGVYMLMIFISLTIWHCDASETLGVCWGCTVTATKCPPPRPTSSLQELLNYIFAVLVTSCDPSHNLSCLLSADLLLPPSPLLTTGVLHVSPLQSRTCMQDFNDLQLSAPDLRGSAHSVLDVLQAAASHSNSSSERTARVALCLATPEDGIEDSTPTAMSYSRSLAASTAQSAQSAWRSVGLTVRSSGLRAPAPADAAAAGTRSLLLQEELAMLECAGAAAWHATEMCEHTAGVLQASAAVRRQRRRALIRALRGSRDAVSRVVEPFVAATSAAGPLSSMLPVLVRQ